MSTKLLGPVENKDTEFVWNNNKDKTNYGQEEPSTYRPEEPSTYRPEEPATTVYQPPTEELTEYYETPAEDTHSDQPQHEIFSESQENSHEHLVTESSHAFSSHFVEESENIISKDIDKIDDAIADIDEAIRKTDSAKSEEIDFDLSSGVNFK